ncbi:hypothetical protein Cantr_10159 [Candida viswanathii]|uniref:Uncharacterized protein n=1 Tax=Candida viswanathii TaxID=5486 RepID=A0A367YDL6_9ASCO|nr:hypothetical protein Cantr_10159 [Candida viswanathii]
MPKVNKIIQKLINQERIQLNEYIENKPLISTTLPTPPPLKTPTESQPQPQTPPQPQAHPQLQRRRTTISRSQPYITESSKVSLIPLFRRNSTVHLSSSSSSLQENRDHDDELFPFINFNEFEFSHRGTILNTRTRSSRKNQFPNNVNNNSRIDIAQRRLQHHLHPLPSAHHMQNNHPNTNNNSSTSSTVIQRTNDNLSIVSSNLGIEDNFYLNIISDDASFQPHINTIFQNNSVGTSGTMINPNGVQNGSIRTASSTKYTAGRKLVQKLYTSLDYASDHVLIEEEEDDYEEEYQEVDAEEETQIHLKIRQSLERQMLLDDPVYGGASSRKISKVSKEENDDDTIQELISISSRITNTETPYTNTPLVTSRTPQPLLPSSPHAQSLLPPPPPPSTATALPPTSSSYRTTLTTSVTPTGTATATTTSSTTKHCLNSVLNYVKKKVKHVRTYWQIKADRQSRGMPATTTDVATITAATTDLQLSPTTTTTHANHNNPNQSIYTHANSNLINSSKRLILTKKYGKRKPAEVVANGEKIPSTPISRHHHHHHHLHHHPHLHHHHSHLSHHVHHGHHHLLHHHAHHEDNMSTLDEVFVKDDQVAGALLYIISEYPDAENRKLVKQEPYYRSLDPFHLHPRSHLGKLHNASQENVLAGKTNDETAVDLDRIEESSNDGDDEQSDCNLHTFGKSEEDEEEDEEEEEEEGGYCSINNTNTTTEDAVVGRR